MECILITLIIPKSVQPVRRRVLSVLRLISVLHVTMDPIIMPVHAMRNAQLISTTSLQVIIRVCFVCLHVLNACQQLNA